ncbi:MAG: 50S ribosomal protein L29 [Prevotellaceae bacterium]|jgi:large subunit ribosomal protein L29|nr:50S ribosomal protein L29 [Prevotellaceae bacterium]
MTIKEVRELTDNEIRERLDVEREQFLRLRLNHSITPLDNPSQLRVARKTIARLITELHARELKQQ